MLQKMELTQQEKDKLEINPNFDFREIASREFDQITKNEIGMFKWSGIYHQLQKGYFMMRLRCPGGIFNAAQLKRAGEMAIQYAQNEICLSTRQCVQFHWLRKEDLYKVIEGMEETGITITNACGDVVRNVCSCPGMGVCPYEEADSRAMLTRIANDPEFLETKRNLPRKHKIAVSGCNSACGMQLLNCQSWVPSKHPETGELGWTYYAGGGLGRNPYMAKKIYDWVPEDLVTAITRAGVEAHNRHGDRRQRRYARLKIVVDRFGQKGYAEEILNILRETGVEAADTVIIAEDEHPKVKPIPFAGQAVVPEKTPGLNTVRVIIKRSEISGDEAIRFAEWAEEYGNGEIMFTPRQNLELRGVSDANLPKLKELLLTNSYRLEGLEHLPDVVACVGTTMCNLAVSDTPNAYRRIMAEFADDEDYWREIGPLRVNMNGCPNNCAHAWIADIGLRGRRLNLPSGGSEEGFTIFVGGHMDDAGNIGEDLIDSSTENITSSMRAVLDVYLENRTSKDELFKNFVKRIDLEEFRRLTVEKLDLAKKEPVNKLNMSLYDLFDKVVEEAK